MDHLVSIVMPAYNGELFIAKAIESVLSQTYPCWELLIVDDGSKDGTKEIILKYCEKDRRIKYYYQQNGRQGKARNLALKHAKGEYIAFLDCDDLWLTNKLEYQINQITQNNFDLIFSGSYIFEDDFEKEPRKKMDCDAGVFYGTDALSKFMIRNRIPALTVLLKAEAIKKVGGFTEKPDIQNAEDYHLWLRLLLDGRKFYGSSEQLAAYRNNVNSSTGSDPYATKSAIAALLDIRQYFPAYNKQIKIGLKEYLRNYHYSKNNWHKKEYRALIVNDLQYRSLTKLLPFYLVIFNIFGLRCTRKLITLL